MLFRSASIACTLVSYAAAQEPTSLLPTPTTGKQWQLVWNDEFNGTVVDGSKWERPNWARRDHFWRRDSAFLNGNGQMVLRTEKIGDKYYSPCIRTIDRYEKKFGYFETRAKLPKQQGHWTAFWLYHPDVNIVGNDGRDGTEIDIFEFPARDGRVHHALHWDGYGSAHKNVGIDSYPANILDGEYHVFSLWWREDLYIFYVDGKEVWRTSAGGVCQRPLYLKWSTEIGDWAGDITKATLPDDTLIDYVRVFDLVDAPSQPAADFRIRSFERRNGTIHLSFPTTQGRTYTIDASPDLIDWTPVTNHSRINGSGSPLARSFPDPASNRHFFRVREN